jgi:DNA (cytosine-5)-methyltransferase 1
VATNECWTVIDLFSGAGGMSYGFHAHPQFRLVGAADAQLGKPSSARGTLQCNRSYHANIGVQPLEVDLGEVDPHELRTAMGLGAGELTVLCACPPCTGFTRTLPNNHLIDDERNSLVTRCALFVEEFRPAIFLMENARELINGKFTQHYSTLKAELEELGYRVHGQVHLLNRFGLPQIRERAIVIAVRDGLPLRTLEDLWWGWSVKQKATHVRRAIEGLPPVAAGEADQEDPLHTAPGFSDATTLRRLQLTPRDGGSWADLKDHPEVDAILIPSMLRCIAEGNMGSHPDVYGRLWWDRPAVTIKRECAHIGNGRYAHPEQNRLCTVREMAILQGFPRHYRFISTGLANMYRHIGDAVPPLISYQLAHLCAWMLTGQQPKSDVIVLPDSHLAVDDICVSFQPSLFAAGWECRERPFAVEQTLIGSETGNGDFFDTAVQA